MSTSSTDPTPHTPEIVEASGAADELFDTVLHGPDQGSGYLYAKTAGGMALSAFGVGFAAVALSLANTHIVNPASGGFFVPLALATGALALLVGGMWEFRGGRTFSGTFGVMYAGF